MSSLFIKKYCTVSVVTAENRLLRNERVNKSKKPIRFISKKKNISAHASHFFVSWFSPIDVTKKIEKTLNHSKKTKH